jgi:hypothetical protein
MHRLLKWANKREVARELSRRGFDVSGETLNRWVRDEREFPAVVERMVLDMYGIAGTTKEAAPPEWAERLQERVDSIYARQDVIMERQGKVGQDMAGKVIEALAPLDRLRRVPELERRLDRLLSQLDVDPPERTDTEDQGEAARADQGLS